jgi:valyl-tRNA synthetase
MIKLLLILICNQIGNITALEYVSDKVDGALSFRVKSEIFYPITGNINVEEEIAKLTAGWCIRKVS